MKHTTAKTIEWQSIGGSLTIPDGYCVNMVDLDAEEPFAIIFSEKTFSDEQKIKIPKSLAYYLSTHFCGSRVMKESMEADTRRDLVNSIEDLLGITLKRKEKPS